MAKPSGDGIGKLLIPGFILLAVLLLGMFWRASFGPGEQPASAPELLKAASPTRVAAREFEAASISWSVWSPAAVDAARKNGRPVLVDFKADWSSACQINRKTSIEIPEVWRKLNDFRVVLLSGDYTKANPAIAKELEKYKRSGVPLTLVFPADPSAEPIVLPELLTPNAVIEALDKAAQGEAQARPGISTGVGKQTPETGAKSMPVLTPLVSQEMVEQARKDFKTAKLLSEAGRAEASQYRDAETHLKWAEAMYKGDARAALEAKRDGAAKKYERVKLLAGDRLPRSELAKAARELAEAEAVLKQFDLKEAK